MAWSRLGCQGTHLAHTPSNLPRVQSKLVPSSPLLHQRADEFPLTVAVCQKFGSICAAHMGFLRINLLRTGFQQALYHDAQKSHAHHHAYANPGLRPWTAPSPTAPTPGARESQTESSAPCSSPSQSFTTPSATCSAWQNLLCWS